MKGNNNVSSLDRLFYVLETESLKSFAMANLLVATNLYIIVIVVTLSNFIFIIRYEYKQYSLGSCDGV